MKTLLRKSLTFFVLINTVTPCFSHVRSSDSGPVVFDQEDQDETQSKKGLIPKFVTFCKEHPESACIIAAFCSIPVFVWGMYKYPDNFEWLDTGDD